MPAPSKPPANVEEQASSAAANPKVSEEAKQLLVNKFLKYMKQSLTEWQVDKIREFADDTKVATLLTEWKVTHEESSVLMDSLMGVQVKAHELSRQISSRLADLEEEKAKEETSDNIPPAAKAGKLEAAGSPSNPGGTGDKVPPPGLQQAKIEADTDASRDQSNRSIEVSEPQSRSEVAHSVGKAEKVRKEREDKETDARVRQDKIRRELNSSQFFMIIEAEKEIMQYARQDAAAKSTVSLSPTSPAEEEEVTRPPVKPFEEPTSDSEIDVERELTLHPEWADAVDQAGDTAVKDIASRRAENRNCSQVMQTTAVNRARRKCVQKLRNDAEKAIQANKDAGKRAASTVDNDPLRLRTLGGTSTHAPAGSGGGGASMGSGSADNRPSTPSRRKNTTIGQIKKLVFKRPPPTSGLASEDNRVLADGTMITPEEEALERAVALAAELNEKRRLPRRVNIRTPVTRPIERLSVDEILHFFPKDSHGFPKVLREGDNWLRTVIIKNLNEMLSEDEFIGRYLEPHGELTFTSLERFESHRVNACGRPKQYMIATFRNWMGAIRCLLAVNGIPRDPKLPSGRPYEVNLFNCNVDEVRYGQKIIDGKRYGAECLAGNGLWHSRIPWRNSRGQLTYPEYEWWWSNVRGGSDANLISLHRQTKEPDQGWIESYERETKKKVRSLERPQLTDEEANA